MQASVRHSGTGPETGPETGSESGPESAVATRDDGWLTLCVSSASAALFLALAWPILSGRIYGGDDLTAFHLPVRWFYWNALHNGDAFDWLPDILCGFFLTGEGQGGTYHPVHLALYRWLSLSTAFNLEVWLSYPAMFAGMVLLLSRGAFGEGAATASLQAVRDDRAAGLPLHAALFGAMLFTFSSSCLLHFMHINAIAVVAHLPWLLWAIDVGVRSGSERARARAFAAIALLTGSTLLCGHPQYVWICFVGELFWLGLAIQIGNRETPAGAHLLRAWHAAWRFGLAKALGVVLGAIQLLPTLDHLLGSQRLETAVDVATHGSLRPLNVVQFFAPFLLSGRVDGLNTHEYGLYAGAVPVVLGLWLCSQRATLGRARGPLTAVAFFGAVAFVLSLGGYGGLHGLLAFLPGVGEFRLSARYLVLVHLAIAILAAAALARLGSSARVSGHAPWPGGWKIVALSGAVALALRLLLPIERVGSPAGAAIGPVLFAVAVWLFTLALRGERIASALLIVLAAADAGLYGLSYVALPASRTLESVVESLPAPEANAARLATFQPDDTGKFLGNQWILRGWRMSDGYAGLLPANRLDGRSLVGLRLSAVGTVLRRGERPMVEGLLPADDRMDLVPDPLPRFRLATRAIVAGSPASDSASIRSGALANDQLATTVMVEAAMALEGPAGEATVISDRPGALDIEVRAPGSQLLVVADRYHAGWRADVNGEPFDVQRVDGDFMGVPVKAGDSTVRMRFEPASLRYGKMVSLAGVVAWILLVAANVFRLRADERTNAADLTAGTETRSA